MKKSQIFALFLVTIAVITALGCFSIISLSSAGFATLLAIALVVSLVNTGLCAAASEFRKKTA